MALFLSVAILLGLAALFGYVNERFLRMQATIGLMLMALGMSFALTLIKAGGGIDVLGREQTLVSQLDFGETLLNGVLCFMLFAGSAGVQIEGLKENKWTIVNMTFAVVAFSILIQGSTIGRLFKPDYLKSLVKPS